MILTMKLKKKTSVDLNNKTLALLQTTIQGLLKPKAYFKLYWNSVFLPCAIIKIYEQTKTVVVSQSQTASILFNFCPSVPSFVFALLFKCFFAVLIGYFYGITQRFRGTGALFIFFCGGVRGRGGGWANGVSRMIDVV